MAKIKLHVEELEPRIAPSVAPGQLGYEGQPGNQGNNGSNGNPGNSNNNPVSAGAQPQPNGN